MIEKRIVWCKNKKYNPRSQYFQSSPYVLDSIPEGDAECIADAYLQARIRDSSHCAGTHRMVHGHCEVTKVAFPVLPSKIARYVFTTR